MSAASACVLGSRGGGGREGVFPNKKGEPLNSLKSLDPKRQIRTVDRQEWALDRQNSLALLSDICQPLVR